MSKVIKKFFWKIYALWCGIMFTSWMTLFGLPGIVPYFFGRKYGAVSFFFFKVWCTGFSWTTGVLFKMIGQENVSKGHSQIFVSNHTSFLDALAIVIGSPKYYIPLGKKELLKVPVLGAVFNNAAVLVDRKNEESRRESVQRLRNTLDDGISIFIFPEGTQNRTEELLTPFYDGAFRIALETQRPIQPMIIINAGKLMPPNKFSIRPGTVKVVYGKEYDISGKKLEDLKEVKEEVRLQMLEMLEKHQPS
ncbi:MAG: lysophospholipid acyltransferase family protein [Bacteroidota bacterium]